MAKKLIARGFGARYGKTTRVRYAEVEIKQRKKQHCPFCGKTAKRIGKGIWECKLCKKKFASHVYYIKEQFKENKKERDNKEKI